MNVILRRRKLGRTSCREIAKLSGMTVVRNDRKLPEDINWLFRWGCTSQAQAKHIVNTCEAIETVCDKIAFRKLLLPNNLCPKTWFSFEEFAESRENKEAGYPVILRPRVHAQGRKLHLCNNDIELVVACELYPEYYISEYIQKEEEYRVFVCQGRAVWVAKKIVPDKTQVAWNVHQGATFENVRFDEWPLKAVRFAIEASKSVPGLTFAGIDIMTKGKDVYVLEANAGASQTSPYRQACVAKAFKWIVDNNSKKDIPLVDKKGDWKKWAHPTLDARVLMV